MKLVLTIAFVILTLSAAGNAQDKEQSSPCPQPSKICDPRKFDEYGKLIWSDEEARLDNVAAELKQNPDDVVYLYVYNGRQGCAGEAQARANRAKDYLVRKRGIESNRVFLKDGGHRENITTEIWVWPRAAIAPDVSPTVDPSEARLRKCKAQRRTRLGKS